MINNLKTKIDPIKIIDYSSFKDIFINVFNTHPPVKSKIIRAKNHELMTKGPRKAIITRSRLKKVYLKNKNTTNWSNYKYQRNFSSNLRRKLTFCNLNVKDLNDNQK